MVNKDNKKNFVKIGAGVLAGLLVAGVPLAVGMYNTDTKLKDLTTDNTVLKAALEAEKLNVKEVEVEVPIDNEKLAVVEQFIYDNDGDLDSLDVTQLDDDEVSLIADRIVFVNEVKDLAVNAVKTKLFDELDNKVYFKSTSNEVEFNDKELGSLRVNDDYEDLEVKVTDFDEGEATVIVTGSFKQEGKKYYFNSTVSFEDNEVDDIKVDTVSLTELA